MRVCPHCRTEYGPEVRVCPNDGAHLDDAPAVPDRFIGQVLAERYRIIRALGEGGMGRVYLAEHVRMGRLSAIKVMSPSVAPTADAIGRFNREAANASRINHPNVAAIYDFGETADGTLYLAMEYIEGETLAQLLTRTGPLALPRVGDLARQIGEGLRAAHQLGIVHRDLKPDNILVSVDADGIERVKLVDFGIAKVTGEQGQTLTTAGVSVGTPEYMSPEQLAGSDIDFRTDIYSLGLVVFAMLTNELPYPPISSKDSLVQRLTEPPRPLSAVAPHASWSPELQLALDRAMSPEAKDRFARVDEFTRQVAAVVGAAEAAPDPRTRRMTPLESPASGARGTQPVRHGKASPAPKLPVRRRRSTKIGASAIVAAIVLAFGIRRYATSSATPEPGAPAVRDSLAVARPVPTAAPGADTVAVPVAKSGTPTAPSRDSARARPTVPTPTPAPSTTASATTVTTPPAGVPAGLPAGVNDFRKRPGMDSVSAASVANLMNRVGRRAGQHTWLRANGDSSDAATPAASLIAAETREITGHIRRAERAINANQLMRGLPELRTAYEEYLVFAADHPGTPETVALGNEFKTLSDRAFATCTTMRDAAVARGQSGPPCEMLKGGMNMMMNGGPPRP